MKTAFMEMKEGCKNVVEQCFMLTAKAVAARVQLSHAYTHRLITENIGKWHRAVGKPLLSDMQKSRRLQMAQKMEGMMEAHGAQWLDNVIFTDESYIQEWD